MVLSDVQREKVWRGEVSAAGRAAVRMRAVVMDFVGRVIGEYQGWVRWQMAGHSLGLDTRGRDGVQVDVFGRVCFAANCA